MYDLNLGTMYRSVVADLNNCLGNGDYAGALSVVNDAYRYKKTDAVTSAGFAELERLISGLRAS